jgi:hypothetical protein
MAFWSCSDPFVNALRTVGYNIIRLPKADVRPLQLLYQNGKNLERLGAVTKLLTGGENVPVPRISRDAQAVNISGTQTGQMKIGFGLSLLGMVIGSMGGSTLGIETEYKNAKTAAFEFLNVLEDKIEIIDLDKYLGDADINPASVYVSKLLEADKLFITTAVIKSTKFTFEARDSGGVGIGVDVPAIQDIVSGNVKVGRETNSSTKIFYEGKTPLVFGFQAVRVFYNDGSYAALKPASGVTMKDIFAENSLQNRTEKFVSENIFVSFDELN